MNAKRILALLASALGAQDLPDPAADLAPNLGRFVKVFSIVHSQAADKPNGDQAIFQGALPGALRQLDPHSIFFDPENFKQLQEMERSVRRGFGTIVQILPGRVVILQTQAGSPSARAGLLPGDEILGVNGYALQQFEAEQIMQLLQQARQQTVRLDVRRQNTPRLLQFELTPASMDAPSVDRIFHLEPGLGFIRCSSFEGNTAKDLRAAIEKLGGHKLKGLVLDLRANPGGVLPAALEIASMFLKPGQRIISVKGRSKKTEEIDVPANAVPYAFPVAVIVNAKSASASEIVAAALQDHQRGTIVGEPTFGKGLVQSVFPTMTDTAVALTVAYYYSPNGRNLQRPLKDVQVETPTADMPGGVKPDITPLHPRPSRLHYALEASGAFTAFATEYTRREKIADGFEVTPRLADEFRGWLIERRIQPGMAEWTADARWIQQRLKQEIYNLALGVEKGDEIEMRNDLAVIEAIRAIKK